MDSERSRTNVVLIGRVDHGKSTVLGRLLFEAGVVPHDRYESIRLECERTGKPFEYAFLLDALKEERKQGITIDAARAVLRLPTREFLFFDAPGHVEFTRNLASGATHAEACIIVIDAEEGATETLEAHAQIVSLLAFRTVIVVINKIDLINFSEERVKSLETAVCDVLARRNISATHVIPVSGMEGANIATNSASTPWYSGQPLLEVLRNLDEASAGNMNLPFRMAVQDVYKSGGETPRLIVGTVQTGTLREGDSLTVLPSGAKTKVRSIRRFGEPMLESCTVSDAVGIETTDPIFVTRGDLLCGGETAVSATRFKALLLWLGKRALHVGDSFQLSVGTKEVHARLIACEVGAEVAERNFAVVDIESASEVAFDPAEKNPETSTLAIAQECRIQGFGRILEAAEDPLQRMRERRRQRQGKWERSLVSSASRAERLMQRPVLMVLTGGEPSERKSLAKILEAKLFSEGRFVYYLGFSSFLSGIEGGEDSEGAERMRRFGELTHVLLDSGSIVIATIGRLSSEDVEVIKIGVEPYDLVTVDVLGDAGLNVDVTLRSSNDISLKVEQLKSVLIEKGALFRPW